METTTNVRFAIESEHLATTARESIDEQCKRIVFRMRESINGLESGDERQVQSAFDELLMNAHLIIDAASKGKAAFATLEAVKRLSQSF